MSKLANMARMTTATAGTGTITLGSAVAGYLTFANAGVANGEEVTYVLEEGSNREIGRGVYTNSGTTLTRAAVYNSTAGGTTKITLTGNAQVFIDAAAQDFVWAPDVQTFAASGTWNKPTDQGYNMALIECWGGGGSGANRTTTGNSGGGGGGGYNRLIMPFNQLGATETVTIGAGGTAVASSNANGVSGGDTSFGSWVTAFGGGGGGNAAASTMVRGGGGGGSITAGGIGGTNAIAGSAGGGGGGTGGAAALDLTNYEFHARSDSGGAGGGGCSTANNGQAGGRAAYGGGGGGSTASANQGAGGISTWGGNGGSGATGVTATSGSQPGGGGGGARNGGSSGAGGAGQVRVTCS